MIVRFVEDQNINIVRGAYILTKATIMSKKIVVVVIIIFSPHVFDSPNNFTYEGPEFVVCSSTSLKP